MQMLKHVGRHDNKKIVLVYRQIPGDEHMCLVLYSDALPQMYHDEVMTCLESAVGQNSEELADALFRVTMKDGTNCLEALHRQGLMKKVNTNQVVITPNAKSSVRLDELNTILNEMKTGEEAIKKMAEMDANTGMSSKKRTPREVGVSPASRTQEATPSTAAIGDVLTDEQLAAQRIAQAASMKLQAEQLIAEAKRLEAEAVSLNPAASNGTTKTRKTAKKKQAA